MKWLAALVVVLAIVPWVGVASAEPTLNEQLIGAAALGDLPLVTALFVAGADVNGRGPDGWTALMSAAAGRYLAVVKVPPLMYDKTELVPALEASHSGRADVAGLLLYKGADVNAATKDGWTALMWAAREGHADVVKLLLDNRADPNRSDRDGRTALMWAADSLDSHVVSLLLRRGADVNARDAAGWSALMGAAWSQDSEVLRRFLEKGIDPATIAPDCER